MKTVRDILREKGRSVWTVGPDATVFEALQLLAEKNVGALLIMEGEDLLGIFSERDYARKIALAGKASRGTPVREIMTPAPVCVSMGRDMEECMALMTDKHVRHLPVIEGDRVVGIVSIGDVVKAIISDKEFVIAQLEMYIKGHR